MHRSHVLALGLLLSACGGADEAVEGLDASRADATTPDAPRAGDCPAGAFSLESIACYSADGETRQTLDGFVAAATASRLHYEPLSDGSCQLVIRFDGPGCTEDQRWTPTGAFDATGRQEMTSTGIAACAPAACSFGAGDDACAVGDHAATVLLMTGVVLDEGDLILDFDGGDGACANAGFPIESQFWAIGAR